MKRVVICCESATDENNYIQEKKRKEKQKQKQKHTKWQVCVNVRVESSPSLGKALETNSSKNNKSDVTCVNNKVSVFIIHS